MTTESYKGHRPGSTSGKLHKIFDKDGQEAAAKAAKKLGLLPHTARSLFSRWNNPDKAKKGGKKAAKANARKATGKSKTAKKAAPKKAAKKTSAPTRERLATSAPAA